MSHTECSICDYVNSIEFLISSCFFSFSPFSIQLVTHSVKAWADKLGIELWHLGNFITRRKEVQDVSLNLSENF